MHQAGRIRIAIHGYNTLADIERLLAELTAAVS
jgi:selenocysteine lyase/cysteine desulfurase